MMAKPPTPFFILTRLGVAVPDPIWFDQFLPFFEEICLPSLEAQTDKDFVWFCVIDDSAPEPFKTHISTLLEKSCLDARLVTFHIQELDFCESGGCSWLFRLCFRKMKDLAHLVSPEAPVITAMIDGDDAWNRETVYRVRQFMEPELTQAKRPPESRAYACAASGGHLLTYESGIQFFAREQVVQPFKHPYHSMSIFCLSLFRSGIFASAIRHLEWRHHAQSVGFETSIVQTAEPMWLYTRHSASMTGDEYKPRFGITPDSTLLRSFGLPPSMPKSIKQRFEESLQRSGGPIAFDGKQSLAALHSKVASNFIKNAESNQDE